MNLVLLQKELIAWFKSHGRDLPWRQTRDPYAIMVSEFMLQQTQVVTVLGYFERWMRRFPDFQTLAAANESEVLHLWQGLGYYARARNLHRAAQMVVARWEGRLPQDLAAIGTLPGVGRYTAGAIASFAFDQVTPAVDANIARVVARLFNIRRPIDSASGSEAIWAAAEKLLPSGQFGGRAHTSALMELGALICVPRAPKCDACPIGAHCLASNPETLPVKKPRRPSVRMEESCLWIVKGKNLLLEQQTGARWRGLWKLPTAQSDAPRDGPLLFECEYSFTHHRVSLKIFGGPVPARLREGQCWFKFEELAGAAFASAHLRAIRTLLPAIEN